MTLPRQRTLYRIGVFQRAIWLSDATLALMQSATRQARPTGTVHWRTVNASPSCEVVVLLVFNAAGPGDDALVDRSPQPPRVCQLSLLDTGFSSGGVTACRAHPACRRFEGANPTFLSAQFNFSIHFNSIYYPL